MGYIIFALIFTSDPSNIRVSRTLLTILASVFLITGYTAIVATAFYSRSLLFLHDAVLLPILTSSFMGIVVTVLNHALHREFAIPTHVYIYVPLVTACTTTIASAVAGLITHRKIAKIKRLDKERRRHVQRWDRNSNVSYGDVASTTELLPIEPRVPEDEAQRQQLLRLLLNREKAQSPGMSSSAGTYKITLPGEEASTGLQVVSPDVRPRSGSLPNTSKWSFIGKVAGERNSSMETFKDPRERRREEIERTSIYSTTPRAESPWLHTPDASAHYQTHTWAPSARYA